MKIITRKEAKAQGLKRYSTGKPCKRGHVAERFSVDSKCVECDRQYHAENREKRLEYLRRWREENRDKELERNRRWREENPEYFRQYREENREKQLERKRQWREENPGYDRQYYEENKGLYRANCAKRHAAKLERTLSHEEELTQFVMEEAAQQAKDMEDAFGMQFHVDHMIPMQGENVSGLHVWYNLQVIPAHLNISKGNRMRYTKPLEWLADAT